MAPGITRARTARRTRPKGGIASIDRQTAKLQAEDSARLAAANRKVEAEQPTPQAPNATPGG